MATKLKLKQGQALTADGVTLTVFEVRGDEILLEVTSEGVPSIWQAPETSKPQSWNEAAAQQLERIKRRSQFDAEE